MIIPDAERTRYLGNLIGGLSMFLVGPEWLRLVFHGFVVLVGTLILSGAVNTAIIGSNGVLNRVAEDGVLTDWFRKPHAKFGTTSRLINVIVILQLVAILVSRGDVYLLGEAYAFGVVWSFTMNALSVFVLRFKKTEGREWKIPFNLRIRGVEIPIGLGLITIALFTLACVNIVTKEVATISGLAFTAGFYATFVISERINKKRALLSAPDLEHFRLTASDNVSTEAVEARPGNVLVAVRNPHELFHLEKVLAKTDTRRLDIVVVTVHISAAGTEASTLAPEQVFGSVETKLFTRVVAVAEKAGKHVDLLVVPGSEPWLAIVQTAQRLKSSRIVAGLSPRFTPAELGRFVGEAWETLSDPKPSLSLEIVLAGGKSKFINLGPHPPRLWPEDVELVHELWLEMSDRHFGAKLHHRDVIGVAIRRLQRDLRSGDAAKVIEDVGAELAQAHGPEVLATDGEV
jgi:hypothetical protein